MQIVFILGQIALMGAIVYFLLIKPENKRKASIKDLQNSLTKGDRVVTVGGLCARVHLLDEQMVTLITDEGVKMKFERQAIKNKIN